MKHKFLYSLCILFSFTLMSNGIASDSSDDKASNLEISSNSSAEVTSILWQNAPIKSKEALIALSNTQSPLDALSSYNREKFIESVQFRKNGIAGYYYKGLEDELTPTQIYSILALIGKQGDVIMFKDARVESKTDAELLRIGGCDENQLNLNRSDCSSDWGYDWGYDWNDDWDDQGFDNPGFHEGEHPNDYESYKCTKEGCMKAQGFICNTKTCVPKL